MTEQKDAPYPTRSWSKMRSQRGPTEMETTRNVIIDVAIIAAGILVVFSCILLACLLVGWIFAGGAGRTEAIYSTAYVLLRAGIITAILLGVVIVRSELESRQRMRDFKFRTGSTS